MSLSNQTLNEAEREKVQRFLATNTPFIGPDWDLLRDHSTSPRDACEAGVLGGTFNADEFDDVRASMQATLDESYDHTQNMIVSPAARFGDMTLCVFTASGDLSLASTRGVMSFCANAYYPIKYVRKYFENDPSVGLKEGDCFIFNDPFYGGLHSPDQGSFMPIFHGGRLVAWAGIGLHEGENGAKDPGGMGPNIESPWDEGLKMPPFRFAERYMVRRDIMNFLQNSCRDRRLMGADLKVKLAACMRIEKRLKLLIDQYGTDVVAGALRHNIETLAAEAQRRVNEMPEGTARGQIFLDTTMREDVLIRFHCAVTVKGGKLIIDMRGCAPQFANRPINAPFSTIRCGVLMALAYFIWPDIPHTPALLEPIEIITDPDSLVSASPDVPTALNMQPLFKVISLLHAAIVRLTFGTPLKYANPMAPWFNQVVSFMYGGMTQHMEAVGNICGDLNGFPGGAKWNDDGEHSLCPSFAVKVDIGEAEDVEEDLPFVYLVSKRLLLDNVGFGKFRGGGGYEFAISNRFSDFWGFAAIGGGSKFSTTPGLFGGYGCSTYPVCRIKNVDVFEEIKRAPERFQPSMIYLMNEQPFENATYDTHRGALPFEMATKGEVYLQSQGAGGGYGDVLDRDPERVMKDLSERVVSAETAREIFKVIFDDETLAVDLEATARARQQERAARMKRGIPYAEFVKQWNRDAPPVGVPYFGGWGTTNSRLFIDGKLSDTDRPRPVFMPDPKDVRIAQLEAQLHALGQGKSSKLK
ncbi:MAG: hydantoinase B/oxoprolinase family protein [Sterolibacterium sp.]